MKSRELLDWLLLVLALGSGSVGLLTSILPVWCRYLLSSISCLGGLYLALTALQLDKHEYAQFLTYISLAALAIAFSIGTFLQIEDERSEQEMKNLYGDLYRKKKEDPRHELF